MNWIIVGNRYYNLDNIVSVFDGRSEPLDGGVHVYDAESHWVLRESEGNEFIKQLREFLALKGAIV